MLRTLPHYLYDFTLLSYCFLRIVALIVDNILIVGHLKKYIE